MIDYGNMTIDEIADEVLEGKSPGEIEREIIESDRPDVTQKSVRYRDESKTVSPHTVEVSGVAPRALDRVHANRSAREQTVDEQYNAPVTLDEEQWVKNKNRLDYPGVDTVPGGALAARAETAATRVQERGAVDRVEHKGSAKNLQGKFSPKGTKTYGREDTVVRVQGTASQPERTLAHELGHALDYTTGEDRGYHLSDRLFDLDTPAGEGETEELTEEAKEVSTQARGDFSGQSRYRREFTELTADVVGQAIIQPRATKRDAPRLFARLEDALEEEGFEDVLGDESDPLGVLKQ